MLLYYPPNVIQGGDFWRKAAVHAQKLSVHESSERKTVEGVHASVVDCFIVFDLAWRREGRKGKEVSQMVLPDIQPALTFGFECEIFSQVTTLVVAAKEKDGARKIEFQRPQIEHALERENIDT